jgi:hypothetical protein
MKKIVISDVLKKHLTIVVYLLLSGVLGYLLADYVAKDVVLTAVFAPVINYILYAVKKELDKEGIIQAIKQ